MPRSNQGKSVATGAGKGSKGATGAGALSSGKPNAKKRSRQDDSDDEDESSAKRAKREDGSIGILTANTLGMTRGKMDKLVKMADDNAIDLMVLQEGVPNVADYVPEGWSPFVTHEAPTKAQLEVSGHKAAPSVGMARYYNALLRDDSGITVTALPYLPSSSQPFRERVRPPAKVSGRGRVSQPPVNLDSLQLAGLRGPQVLQVSLPGRSSVTVYNNHAPQGSGNAKGFSGQDAPLGHEMLNYVMAADPAPHKILIGDQNAHRSSMMRLYPSFDVHSAGSKDLLTHSASSRGLKAQQIDLGDEADAFNCKGAEDCSDHSAMAICVNLPEM